MSHSISAGLRAHLAGEVMTTAMLWLLTRLDNVQFAYTDYVTDLVFDGITYKAANGFVPSTVKVNSSMAVDNMELDSILDAAGIGEVDIMSGIFDYASVQILMVNYEDLSQGSLIVKSGILGDVSFEKGQFTAEIRGIAQLVQQTIGRVYSPACNALLGDSRCAKNLTSFTFSASITSKISNQVFSASALTQDLNYFTGGVITFTSGLCEDVVIEVKAFIASQLSLVLPTPSSVEIGDTFTIIAGCDKALSTCQSKFNNIVNFRGFPKIPGNTAMLTTAGTIQPLG